MSNRKEVCVNDLYVNPWGEIYFLVTNTKSEKYDIDGYLFVVEGEDINNHFYKKASLVNGAFSDYTLVPKEEAFSKLSGVLNNIVEYHKSKCEKARSMIQTVCSILNQVTPEEENE